MQIHNLTDNIYALPALDWDRRLFDELIPLPDGTSYNAYVVQGSQATALIDAVDPTKQDELLAALGNLNLDIDYLVAHHAEQDHSGAIPAVLEKYPEAQVLSTPKGKPLLRDHLRLRDDQIAAVEDGHTLSLGDLTLQFLHAPWVHWPETMLTYLPERRILFTCDFFGSHLATSHLYAEDEARVYEAAKRYYAEIMMPFRHQIRKHLARLEDMDIDVIAPSHGPIHRNTSFIMDAYRDWTSDRVKNQVVLPYVSMHGSVRAMVDYFTDALLQRGITVQPFNLTVTDVGELAMALVDAATVVVGTPTVLGGPHPSAVYAAYLANALRPKTRFASIIGSYGWGGQTVERLTSLLGNLKVEVLEPVMAKGYPQGEDFAELDALADTILKKHENINNTQGGENEGI